MGTLFRKVFRHKTDQKKSSSNDSDSSSIISKVFNKRYASSYSDNSRISPVIKTEEQKPTSRNVTQLRTKRLMKELKELKSKQDAQYNPVFTVDLVADNLYEWNVKLYKQGIDCDSDLYRDMREMGIKYILLNIDFPETFPFAPPFVRVVGPHIDRGFVMEGGAICMELLTPRGWASAYTVEAMVMQFAASVVKGQGRIGRRGRGMRGNFSRRTAEESFRSMVKTHDKYGWLTPSLSEG